MAALEHTVGNLGMEKAIIKMDACEMNTCRLRDSGLQSEAFVLNINKTLVPGLEGNHDSATEDIGFCLHISRMK